MWTADVDQFHRLYIETKTFGLPQVPHGKKHNAAGWVAFEVPCPTKLQKHPNSSLIGQIFSYIPELKFFAEH
jgi:hypothetical protein